MSSRYFFITTYLFLVFAIVIAIAIEKIEENFTDMMAIFNVNLNDSHVTSVSKDQQFFAISSYRFKFLFFHSQDKFYIGFHYLTGTFQDQFHHETQRYLIEMIIM